MEVLTAEVGGVCGVEWGGVCWRVVMVTTNTYFFSFIQLAAESIFDLDFFTKEFPIFLLRRLNWRPFSPVRNGVFVNGHPFSGNFSTRGKV